MNIKLKFILACIVLLLPIIGLVLLLTQSIIGVWLFVVLLIVILIAYFLGFLFKIFLLTMHGSADFLWAIRNEEYKQFTLENWKKRFETIGFDGLNIGENISPRILYKYRNWNDHYHQSLLLDQNLFFPSPLEFNDPFDCRIPLNLSSLDESEYEFFLNNHISIFGNEIQDNIRDFFDSPYSRKEISNSELNSYKEFIQVNKNQQEIFNENNLSRLGVYCLCEDPKNILMWSHYANNHSGICIGFNTDLLEDFLSEHSGGKDFTFLFFDKINYVDEFPSINVKENSKIGVDIFFSKAKNWAYECEWRILIHLHDGTKRIVNVPLNCIEEVYIGCKMPNLTSTQLIKKLEHMTNVKIYKGNKENFKYGLEFTQIN